MWWRDWNQGRSFLFYSLILFLKICVKNGLCMISRFQKSNLKDIYIVTLLSQCIKEKGFPRLILAKSGIHGVGTTTTKGLALTLVSIIYTPVSPLCNFPTSEAIVVSNVTELLDLNGNLGDDLG